MNYALRRIWRNKNLNRFNALLRYGVWQLVKLLNMFPRNINVSKSVIVVKDKNSANEGGGITYTHQLYDYNNMSLLLMLTANHPQTFFDIGANKGIYTLLASESTLTNVHAFEPHPSTFKDLEFNVQLNKRKVNLHNIALGESDGEVKFTDVAGSSTNKVLSDSEAKTKNYLVTRMTSLDQFSVTNRQVPSLIKIDVEGFEYNVLTGGEKTLKECKIVQIEIRSDASKINNLMSRYGYSGPYYYEHKIKKMHSSKFVGSEDPIFINEKYLSEFVKDYHIQIS